MADGNIDPKRFGGSQPRIDGREKVTGAAKYGSDQIIGNPAYGFLVSSPIAKGKITDIDEAETRAVKGVIDVITHETFKGQIKPGKTFSEQGYLNSTILPLQPKIFYGGQTVAMVLAETFEAAREGARRLKVSYDEKEPVAGFRQGGAHEKAAPQGESSSPKVGDFKKSFAAAAVTIEADYETPPQHHNPIELYTTTCEWRNGKLVVHESCQGVYGFQHGLADQLGISPADIRVISPYVGGAFGGRGLTQRTAFVALAAKKLDRPVKLDMTREQGFFNTTYRAETRHHVKLAADEKGRLTAFSHEGFEVTSQPDEYSVAGVDASTRMYACPNVYSHVETVHADRGTPGFMRAPAEVPYMFALESAMDELAYALDMDPLALRRLNEPKTENIKGLPFGSRPLLQCYDAGAKAFGWSKRSMAPGSMRDGDWLIGWGCAAALYPAFIAPAAVRLTLSPEGWVRVQCATHEIGNGAYTVMAISVSEGLGVPIETVRVELGDTDLPPAPIAGGSNSTATVCNAIAKACEEVRARLATAAVSSSDSPLHGQKASDLVLRDGALVAPDGKKEPLAKALGHASNGAVEVYTENLPEGAPPEGIKMAYKGIPAFAGGTMRKDRVDWSYGAQFVEVRVHARTREVRCPRLVGAFAAGRIMNHKAAVSQLMGGQIWGLSSALHEATEIDRRHARYVNTDLAEYMLPVNADLPSVETLIVPEIDTLNPLGIKGVGELGIVGVNAAVANAVFHATGVRVRELPVRLEKLLGAPASHA